MPTLSPAFLTMRQTWTVEYSLCLRLKKIGSLPLVSSVFVAFKTCQRWGVIVTLRVLLPLPNRVTKAVLSAFSRRSFHLRLQNSDTLARVSYNSWSINWCWRFGSALRRFDHSSSVRIFSAIASLVLGVAKEAPGLSAKTLF